MIEREFDPLPKSRIGNPGGSTGAGSPCCDHDPSHPSPAGPGRVILVDGFNVLHAVLLGKERQEGWWRRAPRERLLRRISGWPVRSDEIWVAFDGKHPAWSVWVEPERIEIPSSATPADSKGGTAVVDGPGPIVHSLFVESADDWIVRRARRTPSPERMVVVSGDHKVAGRARSAGCAVWTPWALISQCPAIQTGAGIGIPARDNADSTRGRDRLPRGTNTARP